jgi:hypothetical protein
MDADFVTGLGLWNKRFYALPKDEKKAYLLYLMTKEEGDTTYSQLWYDISDPCERPAEMQTLSADEAYCMTRVTSLGHLFLEAHRTGNRINNKIERASPHPSGAFRVLNLH